MILLAELIWAIIIQPMAIYPPTIHLPTGTLLNTRVDSSIPVIAPKGESKRDRPREPSEKCMRLLMPGMAATQIPNIKLEVANKNPTAKAVRVLIKEVIF